jgi:hypothetical protein
MSYKTSEAIWTKLKKIHDQWPYESIRHVQQQFFDITMEEGKNIINSWQRLKKPKMNSPILEIILSLMTLSRPRS